MEAYLRSSWILISTIYHLCLRCCAGGHREPARHSHQPDRAVRSCPRGVEVPPLTLISSPWAVETGTRDHGRGPFWAPPSRPRGDSTCPEPPNPRPGGRPAF